MQARFKFRYYNTNNNKIYNVTAIDFLHSRGEIVSFSELETLLCKLDLENLIPCTGKVDKNGVLAYEGDIVELCHFTGENCDKHENFVIVEDKDGTGFQLKPLNPNKYGYRHIHRLQYDYAIIGNKFDNPELLED